MSPFPVYGQSWPSPGGTTWSAENAQGEECVRISVTAKEKLKFWPTEAVVQYRLREQGAHAKPLLAKLEDQTERFRLAVEAIDLALAGQPHDDDDKPPSKTGDNARAAEETLLPSVPRTTGFAFQTNVGRPPWVTNVPPPPWATNAPTTPTPTRTPTRTPTATSDNGDADEDLYGRGSGGGGRSYLGGFATTASGSSSPPQFSPPVVARSQSNLLSAAGGGAFAALDLERPAPKRPLSLKELCEGLVVSAVALDNVMDVLSAVGRHSDAVKEHCLKFIGRNFSRARKVEEIRAALEETVDAHSEWGAAVRRHIENAPRVRVEAVVLGPKEKDNNLPVYGQPTAQTPGFSAHRDCYVVIPLPRAATEAAGPTDDAEAALEANRRVTGVIDSLLRHSFLPHQLQLAQNHLSFSYSSSQTVVKFVSHAKTEPLPAEVMKRLRDKAHSIALTQATAQGLGTLRLRNTNVFGHVQRKGPPSPMDIVVGLSSPAYAPIVYQAQLQATFEVKPTQP